MATAAEWLAAGWNPRFAAYALSLGTTPEELRATEDSRERALINVGFIAWNGAHLNEYRKARGLRPDTGGRAGDAFDHDDYTAWLLATAPAWREFAAAWRHVGAAIAPTPSTT